MDKLVVLARGLGTRMRRDDAAAAARWPPGRRGRRGHQGPDPHWPGKGQAFCGKARLSPFRPFLDYVLSAAADAGFRRVCLVIGPEQEAIRRYYGGEAAARAARVSPSPVQPEPKGTADAVAAAESFAGGDPFAVINSDNYYPVEALRALREQPGCAVALFERDAMLAGSNVPEERIKRFAVAKIDGRGCLERIIEKPDDATLAALPQAALAEHELLAVRAVDLRGVPGDRAVAPRRVRDPRRRAVRHPRAGRDFSRGHRPRAGARHDQPGRHRPRGGHPGENGGETMIELSYPGDLTDADELAPQLSTTGLSLERLRVEGAAVRQGGRRAFGHRRGRPRPAAAGVLRARPDRGAGQAHRLRGRADDGRRGRAGLLHGRPAARRPADDRHRRRAAARPIRFHVDPELTPQTGSWSNYPMTVARRVARNFPGAMPRRRHRPGERPAAGRRHEQFQRPDGGRVPRPGRGQPVGRPRRVLAQHRQQDRPGRLPGHGRERAEFRHAGGRPRRGHLRRQRGPHRHPLRRAEPHQPVRLLPGRVREDAPGAAGPRVRHRRQRRGGRKDRRGAGKVQHGLAARLGAWPSFGGARPAATIRTWRPPWAVRRTPPSG